MASGRPRGDAPNVGVAWFPPPPSTDDDDLDHPDPPMNGGPTTLDGATVGELITRKGTFTDVAKTAWIGPAIPEAMELDIDRDNTTQEDFDQYEYELQWHKDYHKDRAKKIGKFWQDKTPRFPMPGDADISWAGAAIGALGALWSDIGGNPWDLVHRKDML